MTAATRRDVIRLKDYLTVYTAAVCFRPYIYNKQRQCRLLDNP